MNVPALSERTLQRDIEKGAFPQDQRFRYIYICLFVNIHLVEVYMLQTGNFNTIIMYLYPCENFRL